MSACREPLSFETLASLWSGDLDPAAAAVAEEHLFACDECAGGSDRLARLVGGLRDVIPPVISHAHRDRLVQSGRRIHITPVRPQTEAHAHFTRELDLLIHVLQGDLSRAERVDVDVVRPDGSVAVALEHVPFDAQAGEVLIACQRHYQGLYPGGEPTFRVHAVEGGERRRVGDYFVFHHWE
jgi:hypothetical protein